MTIFSPKSFSKTPSLRIFCCLIYSLGPFVFFLNSPWKLNGWFFSLSVYFLCSHFIIGSSTKAGGILSILLEVFLAQSQSLMDAFSTFHITAGDAGRFLLNLPPLHNTDLQFLVTFSLLSFKHSLTYFSKPSSHYHLPSVKVKLHVLGLCYSSPSFPDTGIHFG